MSVRYAGRYKLDDCVDSTLKVQAEDVLNEPGKTMTAHSDAPLELLAGSRIISVEPKMSGAVQTHSGAAPLCPLPTDAGGGEAGLLPASHGPPNLYTPSIPLN